MRVHLTTTTSVLNSPVADAVTASEAGGRQFNAKHKFSNNEHSAS